MTLSDEVTSARVELIQQVVSIVSAYVSHNAMRAGELPDLINSVHLSIQQLSKEQATVEAKPPESPAVPVKRSVSKDFIVCLEDGKKFKSLKRHLRTHYNLTPEEYRGKWGLPPDYPMVAPNYAAARSSLAKSMGLGHQRRKG